jgi:two-component system, cell cycle sensor histidine kinase and response regulator CckA
MVHHSLFITHHSIAFPRWMKTALVGTMLAILASGVWFYRVQEEQQRRQVEDQLTAIARIKAGQIAGWRAERLANAAVLTESPFLSQCVAQFMADPRSEAAEEMVGHFRSLQNHYRYSDILLVDPEGQTRLSLSGDRESCSAYPQALSVAFPEHRPVFTDLHVGPGKASPHFSIVAPIFSGKEEVQRPIGAVVLVSVASEFPYPLIQQWPVPSKTAETLLVERDGDQVLFLNELHHQSGTALKLRIPLSRTDVPAVMAVLGRKGIVAGIDYRGVEVVSVLLPVSDSPWFMIAKMDAAEAFAGWRFLSVMILGLLLGLVVLAGAIWLTVWQRNRKAYYRAIYLSEAKLRASVERHSITLKSIGDGVIATDAQGRVELLNPVAETLTGWRTEEAAGRPLEEIFQIINEQTREVVENPVMRVLADGIVVGLANHTLLIARDGTERPIVDSGAPIRNDSGEITGVVLVFRDQSAERLAQRLTEIRLELIEYAVTHSLDDVLTKVLDDVGSLVQSPIGFYHFVEADQKTLSLQQWSTRTLKEFCRAEGKDRHYGIGQAGVWVDCVHEKRPVIHNDYGSLPHRKGMPEGHVQVVRELVVPVMRKDKVVAILGVGNKPADYTEKDVDIIAYLADLTWHIVEQKRAEEALWKNDTLIKTVLDNLPVGVAVNSVNPAVIFSYMNDNFPRFYRTTKEKLADPDDFWAAVYEDPELRDEMRRRVLDDCANGNADRMSWTDIPITRKGEETYFITAKNIRIPDSPLMISTVWDVTERKRAEAERERLMAAIDQAGEIVCITDPAGIIQYVNPAFETVTGYTREEVTGQNPRMLKSGKQDGAFYGELWATVSGGRTWKGRMVNRRKDGALYTEEATISPVCDAEGRILSYVAVKRDITEHLRLAAQFQQAQKMESVGRLAGGVAHDYNNMLSVIIGFTELAMGKVDPSQPIHDDLMEVFLAARRSTEITRQLLAFARSQTIAPEVLDLNGTIEGMLKMLRRLIGEDIDLAWLPDTGLWPVRMDPAQIDQILANLCVNARDAITDIGKVTIETENIIFDEAYCADHPGFVSGEFVMLAVSDNGCGMDEETRNHLFEPFFTTKEVGKGTGLGLATVYGIVKQNDGFINIYSEPGAGTTFKIYLPRHAGHVLGATVESTEKIPLSRGETVLLVEDEVSILKMSRKMLESLGYKVLAANDPGEVERLAREHGGRIDLLITDVVMPGMNGRDLSAQIRTISPAIRCLFMSGYTADVIAHRGVLDDGVQFIQKPFSRQALATAVRKVFDA